MLAGIVHDGLAAALVHINLGVGVSFSTAAPCWPRMCCLCSSRATMMGDLEAFNAIPRVEKLVDLREVGRAIARIAKKA